MAYPGPTKRRLAAFAAAVAAASTLTACGGGSTSSGSNGGDIRVLFHTVAAGANPMQVVIDAFEKVHPDVKVTLATSATDTYPQLLLTQLQSGNGPDIIWTTGGSGETRAVLSLANKGFVAPLTQSWATGSLPKSQAPLYVAGGKQYAVPLSFEVDGGVVNENALQTKAGLATFPSTLADLLTTCTTVSAAGASLINLAGSAPPNVNAFIQAVAASFVYAADPKWNAERQAGTKKFSGDPLWTAALGTVSQMQASHCFQDGAAGGSIPALFPAVATSKSVMLFAPSFVSSELTSLDKANTYSAAAFPGATAADTRLVAETSDSVAVNAKSKNMDSALAFAQFLTEPSTQDTWASASGSASLTTLQSGQFGGVLTRVAPLLKDGKYVPAGSASWANPNVTTALDNGVQGLLTGQTTVPEILSAMDQAWG